MRFLGGLASTISSVLLGTGCHALLHTTDPMHEQVRSIVAIHDQQVDDGYGEVRRAQLAADSSVGTRANMVHQPTSMTMIGRAGDQLCFSLSRNMSAVDGVAGAESDARARYGAAHYAYFYYRDLKEVAESAAWPPFAASPAMTVTVGDPARVAGEAYTDSSGDERKRQSSIDVRVQFCGAAPAAPPDARWFALALVYPRDQEEQNRVMLWRILDEAPPPAE